MEVWTVAADSGACHSFSHGECVTGQKAIEQNSKEQKLSDVAAAPDLSHQLTSPEAP